MSNSQPRTLGEAIMDSRYGVRLHDLNERVYRRFDTALTFFALFGGTAAVAGFAQNAPGLITIGGAISACFAVIQALVKPGEQACRHCEAKKRFSALDAVALSMTLKQFDEKLRAFQSEGPPGIRSLESLAFNQNLVSNGFAATLPISWPSRVLDILI